jgi:hypothetical protein
MTPNLLEKGQNIRIVGNEDSSSDVNSGIRSRNIVALHAMRWLCSWLRNFLKKPEGLLQCPRKPALGPYSEKIISDPKLNAVLHKDTF